MARPLSGTGSRSDILIGRDILGFRISNRMGQGSFGVVYRAEKVSFDKELMLSGSSFTSVVAIKCIERARLSASGENNLVEEISTLKEVNHPNIVKLVDIWWDSERVYLLTEFCSGGDLAMFIHQNGAPPEHLVHKITFQLTSALNYLSERQTVHLDIKPLNILLTNFQQDPDVKLADFGFARKLVKKTKALVGSLLYMSPEMVQSQMVDAKADLWSLGTVLYECCYGVPLFASETEDELISKLLSQDPIKLPKSPRIKDSLKQLMIGLLQRNPEGRMCIYQVVNCEYVKSYQRRVESSSLPVSCLTSEQFKSPIAGDQLKLAMKLTQMQPKYFESVAQSLHCVESAIEAEQNKNWKIAYEKYAKAIELFLPVYQEVSKNSDLVSLKSPLRELIDDWLKKGELLKKMCNETEAKLKTCATPVRVSTAPTQLYIPVNRPSQMTPSPRPSSDTQIMPRSSRNYSLG